MKLRVRGVWVRFRIGISGLFTKNGRILVDAAMEVCSAEAEPNLCSLLFEGSFGLLHDCGESSSVNNGKVGKDFTV